MYIKENLKNLRESCNLSKTKLAKEIGVSESIIRNIESGKSKNPTIETIIKICNYYCITIDKFVLHKIYEKKYHDNLIENITNMDQTISDCNFEFGKVGAYGLINETNMKGMRVLNIESKSGRKNRSHK